MKVCMVGYGWIAAVHSESFRRFPEVELDTLVGARPEATEAFARRHGYSHVAYDFEDALRRPDLDAVVLCTPSPLHSKQTELTLRAGKHVLCEIPLATSLREAENVGELADRLNLRLMVCHTERFDASRMKLRQQIGSGELHPLHVVARFHMIRRGRVHPTAEREGWVDNVLWHHGCHTIDAVLNLLGETEALDLRSQFGPRWPGLGVPIDVDMQWHNAQGVLVSVSLSHNARRVVHDITLICEEDTVVWDDPVVLSYGSFFDDEGQLLEAAELPGRYERQTREFLDSVQEGRRPEISAESVMPAMRVLQAAWDQL